MSDYEIIDVAKLFYSGTTNGQGGGKFYQTFILQIKGSKDCYLIYNWGAGRGASLKSTPTGQLQLVTAGPVSFSRAQMLAQRKRETKLNKGYVHAGDWGGSDTNTLPIPQKFEQLIAGTDHGGTGVVPVTEVGTVLDCLRRAGALFSGETSSAFILAKDEPGEAMMIRQGLAASMVELKRMMVQSQAGLDLVDEALGID